MCSYPSSVATFTWTEYTQSCIKFGSKPFADQRSKRFNTKILKMMKRELVRFEFLFSPTVSAWVTRSAISENRSLTIIILSYIALLAALRSDFLCVQLFWTQKADSGNQWIISTHSRALGYCLRSFYKFPKILFRDLSNLFTSASNSNQMLSHNDLVDFPVTNLIQLWFRSRQLFWLF